MNTTITQTPMLDDDGDQVIAVCEDCEHLTELNRVEERQRTKGGSFNVITWQLCPECAAFMVDSLEEFARRAEELREAGFREPREIR